MFIQWPWGYFWAETETTYTFKPKNQQMNSWVK